MQHSWQARVVDRLIEYRRLGHDFPTAWSRTMHAIPPKGRDAELATPRLFDESGKRPETIVSFFREACRRAWHDEIGAAGSGNGHALRHFRPDMLAALDDVDAPRLGRANGRLRQAA